MQAKKGSKIQYEEGESRNVNISDATIQARQEYNNFISKQTEDRANYLRQQAKESAAASERMEKIVSRERNSEEE